MYSIIYQDEGFEHTREIKNVNEIKINRYLLTYGSNERIERLKKNCKRRVRFSDGVWRKKMFKSPSYT